MQIEEVHNRLKQTTLEAYYPAKELRLRINLIEKDQAQQMQLEKEDLGDGVDWYRHGDKYYRFENGKYMDYDEKGNDVVVNFNQGGVKELAIKFSIHDMDLYEYQGELFESQIQKDTQNKLDIYDYFLSLEEDIKKYIENSGHKSIIDIKRVDVVPIHYIVTMSMQYKPSLQVYNTIFKVKCNEIEKTCREQLLISNDKWFKTISLLKQQYQEQEERVKILEEQVKRQNEIIMSLQQESISGP